MTESEYIKLETTLAERKKSADLELLQKISKMVNLASVRQKHPLGLGHAVLCAKSLVGDVPFGVMLGDDMIDFCRMLETEHESQAH